MKDVSPVLRAINWILLGVLLTLSLTAMLERRANAQLLRDVRELADQCIAKAEALEAWRQVP